MAQVEALRAENERVQREIAEATASPASKRRSSAAVAASGASAAMDTPPSSPTSTSTEAAGLSAQEKGEGQCQSWSFSGIHDISLRLGLLTRRIIAIQTSHV